MLKSVAARSYWDAFIYALFGPSIFALSLVDENYHAHEVCILVLKHILFFSAAMFDISL